MKTVLYVLRTCRPVRDRLEAALQGFRTYVQDRHLSCRLRRRPSINVGDGDRQSVRRRFRVEAAAQIVDVQSAVSGDVVETRRSWSSAAAGADRSRILIVLAGAAVQTGVVGTRNFSGGVNISVAEGCPTGVGYLLDGATHNSRRAM
jgi:hypothetical protein